MENKTVGMLIREERDKLKMKVFELAKKVGVHPVYITRIEKHNHLPSIVVYMNIEKILKLSPDLRLQYFKEKYPDSANKFPNQFKRMADELSENSALALLEDFTRHRHQASSPDIKPFVVGLAHNYNPNKTLTDKEIEELSGRIKKILRLNGVILREKINFLKKTYSITKKSSDT